MITNANFTIFYGIIAVDFHNRITLKGPATFLKHIFQSLGCKLYNFFSISPHHAEEKYIHLLFWQKIDLFLYFNGKQYKINCVSLKMMTNCVQQVVNQLFPQHYVALHKIYVNFLFFSERKYQKYKNTFQFLRFNCPNSQNRKYFHHLLAKHGCFSLF